MQEARLYTSNAERERYENMATLFSLIVSLDYLERAYVRDSVTQAEFVFSRRLYEPSSPSADADPVVLTFRLGLTLATGPTVRDGRYTPACTRLLAQYKTILKLVTDPGPGAGPKPVEDVGEFMRRYKVSLDDPISSVSDGAVRRALRRNAASGAGCAVFSEMAKLHAAPLAAVHLSVHVEDHLAKTAARLTITSSSDGSSSSISPTHYRRSRNSGACLF